MGDLFDELIAGQEAAIRQLCDDRRQEAVDIEFKTKANAGNGEVTKDDKKNLGVVLSAFSNSIGGTLVWGVEASTNADGVDCASSLRPISQIHKFHSEITKLASQALMPRHEGILIEAVPASGTADAGYLVIRVDRSERRPHRCEFVEKQYFKRIGNSSFAMEHYDIEDSFKRFVAPALEATMELALGPVYATQGEKTMVLRILLSLKNKSSVSARFPYLLIVERNNISSPCLNVRKNRMPVDNIFEGGADDVIHPEGAITVLELQKEIKVGYGGLRRMNFTYPILIRYRCGSLHSRPTSGTFEVTMEDAAKALGLEVPRPSI